MIEQVTQNFSVKLNEIQEPFECAGQIEHPLLKKVVLNVIDEPNQDLCAHTQFPDS
jgi:hypothetical protein